MCFSELLPIVFFVCVCFELPTVSLAHTHRECKFTPKVSLLRPNGFSVTVEGKKSAHTEKSGEKRNFRSKREAQLEANDTDFSQGKYGSFGIISSRGIFVDPTIKEKNKEFYSIKLINKDYIKSEPVLLRGRLYTCRRRGKQCFFVLRQQDETIQCVLRAGATVSREMVKFVANISRESVIDVLGRIQKTNTEIRSCSAKWMEVVVEEVWVVSAAEFLPIQVMDCARPEKEQNGTYNITFNPMYNLYVSLDKKMDYRVLDLRTAANQAIFRLESEVSQLFRQFLLNKGFLEIHTPKIISAASEGGANVFNVSYFKTFAYLAQSPQLYKQMAIVADFDRVFTVGAVFRAEDSDTSRHLTEFVGLDLEMAFKYHYSEALDVIEQIFIHIFKLLQKSFKNEILTVRRQFYAEPFVFVDPPPRITYSEGLAMLRSAGTNVQDGLDLTSQQEKLLGKLIKEKYNSDFFVLDKYPISVRPFYIMRDPSDKTLSNSYDIFLRGEEVMSGGQRIHDTYLLQESAIAHGVDLNKIRAYVNAFRYGCPPHAGGGIGLERTVASFLGLDNVRRTSMFPRDPRRLTP